MTLRWPCSERPMGGNGLETLQAVSVQLKKMDSCLKIRREGKTGDKPGWMERGNGR